MNNENVETLKGRLPNVVKSQTDFGQLRQKILKVKITIDSLKAAMNYNAHIVYMHLLYSSYFKILKFQTSSMYLIKN